MRTTSSWAALLALLPLLALTGCGPSGVPVASTATASAVYDLPLASTPRPTTAQARIGWAGAAGEVVRCSGPVIGTTSTAPYAGEDTAATPDAALEAARRWVMWDGAQEGFVLARVESARRLYVLEVAGVAKQALILRHGPALTGDGSRSTVTRWWLESWARCDYAELPDAVARQHGLELWTDGTGKRQLTSTIVSFPFTGDCFAGMTALDLHGPVQGGSGKGVEPVEYVGRPAPELRADSFERDFVEHVAVPADAVDTGYERAGEHLWLSKDRGYAYVGQRHDADAWPKAVRPVRCA
jgi:hypothetical protein